jgi:hypothetical protein
MQEPNRLLKNIFGVRRQAQRDAALDFRMPKCEEIQSAAVVGALQISRPRCQ